jgi:ankyrin repeat protein
MYNFEAVVKLLLATNGVELDSKDNTGRTPLAWASDSGHEAVVKLLLESHGIDPDPKHTAVRHSPTRCLGFGIIACVALVY